MLTFACISPLVPGHAGKDLTWWNRGQLNAAETLAAKSERDVELALIKEQEDAMMLEALYVPFCGGLRVFSS